MVFTFYSKDEIIRKLISIILLIIFIFIVYLSYLENMTKILICMCAFSFSRYSIMYFFYYKDYYLNIDNDIIFPTPKGEQHISFNYVEKVFNNYSFIEIIKTNGVSVKTPFYFTKKQKEEIVVLLAEKCGLVEQRKPRKGYYRVK